MDLSPHTSGRGDGSIPDRTKILLGIVAGIIIIVAIAAILTFTMTVTPSRL